MKIDKEAHYAAILMIAKKFCIDEDLQNACIKAINFYNVGGDGVWPIYISNIDTTKIFDAYTEILGTSVFGSNRASNVFDAGNWFKYIITQSIIKFGCECEIFEINGAYDGVISEETCKTLSFRVCVKAIN